MLALYRRWRLRRAARKVAQAGAAYLGGLEAFVAERRAAEAAGRLDEWRIEQGIICAGCRLPRYQCPPDCGARLAGGWER